MWKVVRSLRSLDSFFGWTFSDGPLNLDAWVAAAGVGTATTAAAALRLPGHGAGALGLDARADAGLVVMLPPPH